ncbi:MAG: hypothetical protein KC548_04025 [Nanoarchaeota archaeon]|nr:hypothetical protein [Nanoarchaeota archaeon]
MVLKTNFLARILLYVSLMLFFLSLVFPFSKLFFFLPFSLFFSLLVLYFSFAEWFFLGLSFLFLFFFFFFNLNYIAFFVFLFFLSFVFALFLKGKSISPSLYVLFPLLLFLHILFLHFLPFSHEDVFFLDIGSSSDFTSGSIFLRDPSSVLGERQRYGNETWREFVDDGEVDIVFSPSFSVSRSRADLTLEYESSGEIYVNDELFYDPAWENELDFVDSAVNNVSVYSDSSSFLVNSSSLEEFLFSLYPNGIACFDYTGEYTDLQEKLTLRYAHSLNTLSLYPDFDNSTHVVDTFFRGDTVFAGLYSKVLVLDFDKQDLNKYEGSDDVSVLVRDFSGTLIAHYSFPDDGEVGVGEKGDLQSFHLALDLENDGIYTLEFVQNSSNVGSDFYVYNVSVNTNKFVSVGTILPMRSCTLYFERAKNVSLYFWTAGKEQTLVFDNSSFFDIKASDKGQDVLLPLENYSSLFLEKGNVVLKTNSSFAYWEGGWFVSDLSPQLFISRSPSVQRSNSVSLSGTDLIRVKAKNGTRLLSARVSVDYG